MRIDSDHAGADRGEAETQRTEAAAQVDEIEALDRARAATREQVEQEIRAHGCERRVRIECPQAAWIVERLTTSGVVLDHRCPERAGHTRVLNRLLAHELLAQVAQRRNAIVAPVLRLWDTVLAPINAALEPRTVLLIGDDEEVEARFREQGVETRRVDSADAVVLDRPADLVLVTGAGGTPILAAFDAVSRLTRAPGTAFPVLIAAVGDGSETDASHEALAALRALAERRPDLEVVMIPGLGGAALVLDKAVRQPGSPLEPLLRALTPSPELEQHIVVVEAGRVRALARARAAEDALGEARVAVAEARIAVAERDRLLAALPALADARADMIARARGAYSSLPGAPALALEQETEDHIRLRLTMLGAGAEDLARPRPLDLRGVLADPDDDAPCVVVRAVGQAAELTACLWSLCAHADRRIRLVVAVPDDAPVELRVAVERVAAELPRIRTVALAPDAATAAGADGAGAWTAVFDRPAVVPHGWFARVTTLLEAGGALSIPRLAAVPVAAGFGADVAALAMSGERISDPDPPGWVISGGTPAEGAPAEGAPAEGAPAGCVAALVVDDFTAIDAPPDPQSVEQALRRALGNESVSIAFVLAGVPTGGSGGAISVVQEAAELGRLGVDVRIALPLGAIERARALYPGAAPLLRGVPAPADLEAVLEGAQVVIATEASTVAEVADHAPPGSLRAYYIQDYEALFAKPESARADTAVLSYQRASPNGAFAKTHWLANLVSTAHRVPVGKVEPSLDAAVFHSRERPQPGEDSGAPRAVRVIAMIRPRTPRRRPAATLAFLRRLAAELGERVECMSFGCETAELDQLAGEEEVAGLNHLGVLNRADVAEVMRRCDVFVDLSVYQAFGRTGLEAMACGAVPVLPRLGGAGEYAVDGLNAVLAGDPEEAHLAVLELARDPARLVRMRHEGARTAARYSLTRAAISQYMFLTEALRAARAGDLTGG